MKEDLLNDLNTDQQEAVRHTEGPVLILAGAGSGKTKVITYRVAYLIVEKHISTHNILMVTFTNKAAGEMKERIKKLLTTNREPRTANHELPFAGTFHSLCAKILRKYAGNAGLSRHFVIYDESDQLDAIKDVMKRLDISVKNFKPGSILHTISQAKNELIGPLEYPEYARGLFQETVARVYLKYQQVLVENDAADFDDLLMKTVKLFEQNPAILGEYQERFRYVLVDEYQDTNRAQYVLTKQLVRRHQNICVVGDASQSIYRWRGADFRNMLLLKQDFTGLREFHLEQNYRSTRMILEAANAVISKNTSHPILNLWTENGNGEKILLYEARNEHDEATFIVQTILQANRPFNQFAVLYRTNAQSRLLEEAFLRSGIPYTLVGGMRFYERKEIKDVLSYLRLLQNPKDMVSYKRVEKLGKSRLQNFLQLTQELTQDTKLVAHTTLEILDQTLKASSYLELYDANKEDEAYRLENIKELRSVAMEFPALSDFLENVALMEQEYTPQHIREHGRQQQVVTLMTLHAAKGLEFPVVFIVGMEEGLFPHSRSLVEKDELEEERRLCYVGITRAKERLYLLYANRRLIFGTRTQNMISRFIADIPQEILELHVSLDATRGFHEEDLLL
ncbi:UvrD-helicase domain-containing protein [Patescibacteria group bacterium]|nr:UvrD-helicase domain-containing protein [Patescibacteria group bacterium]MBU1473112.1 UvrD-helicase domain-containing protein [Patescibacteria group bacterium]MBU2459648.1 UvrD-helicase domain-containing protein [Patescibacteria group bacterium]MBU2544449.1 UvrD-helicase domain-containing protein [Patescibacteria group bacterium]